MPEALDLFSAACGGWSLGLHRAGFRTIAACEAVDWRRAIYAQNNPGVPIYDDVRTLTADRLLADLGRLPDIVVGSPPARTSAAPTRKVKASKAKGPASTSKPFASSEKSDLVGLLLKTALISELGALTPSSLHWRRSTTPAGRSWFVLQTSAPTTSGPDHGSSDGMLGTPTSNPAPRGSVLRREKGRAMRDQDNFDRTLNAGEVVHFMLSTPRASDMKAGGHGDTGRMGTVRHQLHDAMLHTPTAMANMHNPSMEKWPSCQGWAEIAAGNPMLPTPVSQTQQGGLRWEGGAGGRKVLKESGLMDMMRETLPTPTKRDKRMDAWSPAYDKRRSPTMDAVVDGAMTNRAPDKWQYARQIAAVLQQANLSGASQTLPVVYSWMMAYPPAWLERALLSAVDAGFLPQASSSRRMETRLCRKSRKR